MGRSCRGHYDTRQGGVVWWDKGWLCISDWTGRGGNQSGHSGRSKTVPFVEGEGGREGGREGEEGRAKQRIGRVQGSSSGCCLVHMHRQGACSARQGQEPQRGAAHCCAALLAAQQKGHRKPPQ